MPSLEAERLTALCAVLFHAAGASERTARIVAASLVESDLAGHESHGVIRVTEYLEHIQEGKLDPRAEPEAVSASGSVLKVDGHWGFGQTVADWTIKRLVPMARSEGIAAGAVYRCGHLGRIGPYVAEAARQGCIGLAFVNGGGKEPRVAPHGGMSAVFGTNPLAAAIPTKSGNPIVTDFSTAVVASGRIRLFREKGERLPEGWVLDRYGRPTREPSDYYDGGMLLPAAGPKGYGLSILVECLAGLLTGAGSPGIPESGYALGNGAMFILLDVGAFHPARAYLDQVEALSRRIKSCPPSGGIDEVMLPGEPEEKSCERRLQEGVLVPEAVWKNLTRAAESVGVEWRSFLSADRPFAVGSAAIPHDQGRCTGL